MFTPLYNLSKFQRHINSFMMEISIIQKPVHWTGFYMIGTSVMKELRSITFKSDGFGKFEAPFHPMSKTDKFIFRSYLPCATKKSLAVEVYSRYCQMSMTQLFCENSKQLNPSSAKPTKLHSRRIV